MTTDPDDLDKLLSAVRKTICDNQLFLQRLVDETEEVDADLENGEGEEQEQEDFEEL